MISLTAAWAKWRRDGTANGGAELLRSEWAKRFPGVNMGKVRASPYEACGIKSIRFMAHDESRSGYILRLRYYPHDHSCDWHETRPPGETP